MEEIKIQVPKWKIIMAILGINLFVLIGVFLLIADTSVVDKILGLLGIVFFGGLTLFSTVFKKRGNIILTPKELKLNFPNCPTIPIVWKDIEKFDTVDIGWQNYTTIKLKSYNQLIKAISTDDAEIITKEFKSLNTIEEVEEELIQKTIKGLLRTSPKSPERKELLAYLSGLRNKFGGEFIIGWDMRDRKAASFAAFLKEQKKTYS